MQGTETIAETKNYANSGIEMAQIAKIVEFFQKKLQISKKKYNFAAKTKYE